MKIMKGLGLALLLMPLGVLAETGSIVRSTQMVESPSAGARPVATLYSNASVEILERDGGWYQVKEQDGGRIGWVRLTSVRLGEQTTTESETGFWGSLFSFGSRSNQRTATATTGIRGLGEDDIAGAVPNQRAVYELDNFYVQPGDAEQYARDLGLQSRQVQHLPEDVEE
ncbi:MAG: SH3 domain-containing protein [Gammaproteobacteria bacterium]|nr:SH3 domain-containing protein [Gammaproteobacteria bacterium]